MQAKILYLEHKNNQNHKGDAWIGEATFSRTGRTVYFNGQVFRRLKSPRGAGNYYDIATGDYYWISGIKKNGMDRHWLGSGKVYIDKKIINTYTLLTGIDIWNDSKYIPISIKRNDKQRFKMTLC